MSITTDPREAFEHALDVLKAPFPAGEPVLAKDPRYAFLYARDVLNAPFPAGEASIAADANFAFEYAAGVHGRFMLGEPAIAKNPGLSYYYANVVLSRPFRLGEPAIATNPYYSYQYAFRFGPFPPGEHVIATADAYYAFLYARDVLKGAFPAGENLIATDSCYSYSYAKEVLKAPFSAGEKVIRSDSYFSALYDQAFQTAQPATPACAHAWVNVGFASVTMACKHCGIDQPRSQQ